MEDQFDTIISGMNDKCRNKFDLMERVMKGYITSPRDKKLGDAVDHWIYTNMSMRNAPNPEGRLIGVVGGPGAGETTAIRRAIKQVISKELLSEKSLLCIKAPHPCTQKQLALAILLALGYCLKRDIRESDAWRLAKEHLAMNSIRFLWIDELHHAIHFKDENETKRVSESIKGLMLIEGSYVGLLLSGLPTISPFLGEDGQIIHRNGTVELEPLSLQKDIHTMKMIIDMVILKRAGMAFALLDDVDFLSKLCIAGDYQLGMIIDITREAVFKAHDRPDFDGSVLVRDFAEVYALKRHCVPSQNIFTAESWQDINPANSRLRDIPGLPSPPITDPACTRRKRR